MLFRSNQWVIAVESVDYARRARDLLLRFEKPGVVQCQAHLVDGVVGDAGKTLAGACFNLVEPQTARGLLKGGERGGRFFKIHARFEQRLQILTALLGFSSEERRVGM